MIGGLCLIGLGLFEIGANWAFLSLGAVRELAWLGIGLGVATVGYGLFLAL